MVKIPKKVVQQLRERGKAKDRLKQHQKILFKKMKKAKKEASAAPETPLPELTPKQLAFMKAAIEVKSG